MTHNERSGRLIVGHTWGNWIPLAQFLASYCRGERTEVDIVEQCRRKFDTGSFWGIPENKPYVVNRPRIVRLMTQSLVWDKEVSLDDLTLELISSRNGTRQDYEEILEMDTSAERCNDILRKASYESAPVEWRELLEIGRKAGHLCYGQEKGTYLDRLSLPTNT